MTKRRGLWALRSKGHSSSMARPPRVYPKISLKKFFGSGAEGAKPPGSPVGPVHPGPVQGAFFFSFTAVCRTPKLRPEAAVASHKAPSQGEELARKRASSQPDTPNEAYPKAVNQSWHSPDVSWGWWSGWLHGDRSEHGAAARWRYAKTRCS